MSSKELADERAPGPGQPDQQFVELPVAIERAPAQGIAQGCSRRERLVGDRRRGNVGHRPRRLRRLTVAVAGKPLQLARGNSHGVAYRSEEHTSELQSLMRISYAVFCLKKKKTKHSATHHYKHTKKK